MSFEVIAGMCSGFSVEARFNGSGPGALCMQNMAFRASLRRLISGKNRLKSGFCG